MSLFNPTICLATLNTFPLPSSSTSISQYLRLSSSWALAITLFDLFLASLYTPLSTSKPESLNSSYALLFSLTANSVSLFHHHVILCLVLPLVLPHTVSVSSNRQSFNPFHIDSRSSSSFLSSLYFTLSAKSFRISVSLSLHTLCLPTNFIFLFFTLSGKSILQINSLCCFTHSSLPMTLMSVTFARSHLLTNI